MSSSLEKRGSGCGFPTLGSRCTDIRISYRWIYGFLIVGFQGIGWARLFYDLKPLLLYAAGVVAELRTVSERDKLVACIDKGSTWL